MLRRAPDVKGNTWMGNCPVFRALLIPEEARHPSGDAAVFRAANAARAMGRSAPGLSPKELLEQKSILKQTW